MLRQARAGRGLRATAEQAGISHGYLTFLERGERCPSLEVAQSLADALWLGDADRRRLLDAAVTDAGRCNPHARARAEREARTVAGHAADLLDRRRRQA
jgi:transcriptional regulator with XRE-family HTH domain